MCGCLLKAASGGNGRGGVMCRRADGVNKEGKEVVRRGELREKGRRSAVGENGDGKWVVVTAAA